MAGGALDGPHADNAKVSRATLNCAQRIDPDSTAWRLLNNLYRQSSTSNQPAGVRIASMSPIRHSDVELRCTCCGDRFVYSAGEQELHAVRGVAREPRECPTCRKLLGRA